MLTPAIQCTKSGDTISGDKNGSDNLKQIGEFFADNDSTNDTGTAVNYPAFYFAKKYSDTATNLGTNYADGWYLPSIAELFQIWKSKDTLDAAIDLCGGDQFGTSYYWSSSQDASTNNKAYWLSFGNAFWNNDNKDNNEHVCAVREF